MPTFDEKASTYDDFCSTPLGRYVDRIERGMMAAIARPIQDETAIDLGCGTGSYTYWLKDLGLTVTGVDISRKMLEVARVKGDGSIPFLEADLTFLPFPDRTFDLAICNAVLEFTEDPTAVLREGIRVLKPGGRLVVGLIHVSGKWGQKYAKRGQEDPTSIYSHAHFFSHEDIVKLLPEEPAEARFGLFVGPDEFQDYEAAMELEHHRQTLEPSLEPGYLVVRWEKPS